MIMKAASLLLASVSLAGVAHADGGNWYEVAQTAGGAYSYNPRASVNSIQQFRDNECNGPGCPAAFGTTSEGPVPWTRSSLDHTVASANGHVTGEYVLGDPRYDGPTSADGFAWVNLATGEIKISHDAVRYGYSSASAQFVDYIHFDPATITSATTIIVDLRVDGSFEGFTQPRFGFGLSNGNYSLNTGTVGWSDSNPNGASTTATANFIDFSGGTGRAGNWEIYGPDRFRGTFVLDPRYQNFNDLSVSMYLSAGGPQDTWTAFQHTAAITFELPDGVSFTSASGAFLTAQDAALPEPATWATMIAGFGLVGGALRRRSRASQAALSA